MYEDIINLPPHKSSRHAPMSMSDRAAQFSPFAALSGHAEAIKETTRRTEEYTAPSEELAKEIDRKLNILLSEIKSSPYVSVTYFVPDSKKEGGAYVTVSGNVERIRLAEKVLKFTTGECIPIDKIISICMENNE